MTQTVTTNGIARMNGTGFAGADTPRKTAGYIPVAIDHSLMGLWDDVDKRFTWYDVPRMKRDPQCLMGLNIIQAPLHGAKLKAVANHPDVESFVDKMIHRVWQRALRNIVKADEYGHAAGELEYRVEKGRYQFHQLHPFHPIDARPLRNTRTREITGIRIRNIQGKTSAQADLSYPNAFWVANDPQYGQPYGQSRLAGAFSPWMEKSGKHGALDIRRLWFLKNAYNGGTLRYPDGFTEVSPGKQVSNQDLAREILEKLETGGILVLPNTRIGIDGTGEYLWQYEAPKVNGGALTDILEYPDVLDKAINTGMGIPNELLEAGVRGSWSGRAVPAQMFFTSLDSWIAAIIDAICRLIIKPLVRVNFGKRAEFEVTHESLAELAAKEPDTLKESVKGQDTGGQAGPDPMQAAMGAAQMPQKRMSLNSIIERNPKLVQRIRGVAKQRYSESRMPVKDAWGKKRRGGESKVVPTGGQTRFGFDPEKHPRGRPTNKGQFTGHGYSNADLESMSPAQRRVLAGGALKAKVKGMTDGEIHAALRSDEETGGNQQKGNYAAEVKELAKLVHQESATSRGNPDPRGDLRHLPTGEILANAKRSIAETVKSVTAGKTVGPPLDRLYETSGGGLTPQQFRAVLLDMNQRGEISLGGWPRQLDELPRPDLAPMVGGKVMFAAHLPGNRLSLDSHGHEHKGKGEGGGQFAKGASSDAVSKAETAKPKEPASPHAAFAAAGAELAKVKAKENEKFEGVRKELKLRVAWGMDAAPAFKKHVTGEIAKRMKSDDDSISLFIDDVAGYSTDVPKSVGDGKTRSAAILVNCWAATSSDHNPLARAIQSRAAEVLGIKGHFEYPEDEDIDGQTQMITAAHGPVIDDFIRATYAHTQETLKAVGIEELVVFRGMNTLSDYDKAKMDVLKQKKAGEKDVVEPPKPEAVEYSYENELQLQPLSSFSTTYRTADSFSLGGLGTPLMMACRVPRERIFSTALTGIGCLDETEVVVTGGKLPCLTAFFHDETVQSETNERKFLAGEFGQTAKRLSESATKYEFDPEKHPHKGKGEGGGQFAKKGENTADQTANTKPEPTAKPSRKAVRGEMASAKLEGTGKDQRVLLADGSPAPGHITPAMIGKDWTDVKIAADPEADVLATGRNAKGVSKTTYNDAFHMRNAAIKFARVMEGVEKFGEISSENQGNRKSKDSATREAADCCWLMQEQATRPGSDADTKGLESLYGKSLDSSNIIVTPPEDGKKGKTKVEIEIDAKKIHIRDEGAAEQLIARKESGNLGDSTYWLKSFGASTLEGRHVVKNADGSVNLQFMGKESVWHDHRIQNPELAKMLLTRKANAGDDGKLFDTDYAKISKYTGKLDGGKFSAKDFRTVRANQLAIQHISAMKKPENLIEYKKQVLDVGTRVSGVLGNRPAQALESYIDPVVFSGWRIEGQNADDSGSE